MAEGTADLSSIASITGPTGLTVAGYRLCDAAEAGPIWFVGGWIFEVMKGRVSILINGGRLHPLCLFVRIIVPIPHIAVLPFHSLAPSSILSIGILI